MESKGEVISEARYGHMTERVLSVMAMVALGVSSIGAMGFGLGAIPLDTLIIFLLLSALFAPCWLLARRGSWKFVRHVPVAFIFAAALYGNLIGGMGAPAILLYVLCFILSATLQGKKTQRFVVLASLSSYLVIAFLHYKGVLNAARNDSNAFYNRILIASSAFIGIGGTLIYLVHQLEDAIRLSLARGDELSASNREMERRIKERTEELHAANADLRSTNAKLEQALSGLKTTQGQLIRTEKLAAFGRIAASISHQLNTPLGAILSASGTLLEGYGAGLGRLIDFVAGLGPDDKLCFARLVDSCTARASTLQASRAGHSGTAVDYSLFEGRGLEPSLIPEIIEELGIAASAPLYADLIASPRRGEMLAFAWSFFQFHSALSSRRERGREGCERRGSPEELPWPKRRFGRRAGGRRQGYRINAVLLRGQGSIRPGAGESSALALLGARQSRASQSSMGQPYRKRPTGHGV